VRLILASASPRRAELLASAGFDFDISPVVLDENPRADEPPGPHVARLAASKARAVSRQHPGALVLGADTVVVVDGRILGKPAGDRQAAEMLRMLSGRQHEVLTGVALCNGARCLEEVVTTSVRFRALSDAEIEWYIASGEPRDKAGAYAVQGLASRFVDRLEGSYSNVVGLPVATVYGLLVRFGGLS
jgi:septum formation protein